MAIYRTHATNLEAFNDALILWRASVRHHLCTDPRGFIGHQYPSLADELPDDFPNFATLNEYAYPLTSPLASLLQLPLSFSRRPPHFKLGHLAAFCSSWLWWRNPDTLLRKFENHVWPGFVLRGIINRLQRDPIHTAVRYQSLLPY